MTICANRSKQATLVSMKLFAAILFAGGCVSGGPFPEEWGPFYRGEDTEPMPVFF